MKTSKITLLLMSAIVLVVLLGSHPIGDWTSLFNLKDKGPSDFAVAHASLGDFNFSEEDMACKNGKPNTVLVPPPDKFFLRDYERELFTFILARDYDDWCVDKKVRDTGPWINDQYYGVHPAVRIYYSPRMMYWLTGDPSYWSGAPGPKLPRAGEVPEGAMIVKEMFEPPADLYDELKGLMTDNKDPSCSEAYENLIAELITSWTVMVRDNGETADGWFWAGPSRKDINDMLDNGEGAPWAGFGLTCIRCHASAESGLTFSDTANIEGIDAHTKLLQFRNDNSWRVETLFDNPPMNKVLQSPCVDSNMVKQLFELDQRIRQYRPEDLPGWADFRDHHEPPVDPSQSEVSAPPLPAVNPAFAETFFQNGIDPQRVRKFPSEWSDNVVPKAGAELQQYITSDNCLGCHGGLGGDPYDVAMFVKTGLNYGAGYNISEYGEWRWSPMGLAGRDPIFYAQLESEMKLLERDAKIPNVLQGTLQENKNAVTNTCLSCHGSMGQRQLLIDARKDPTLDSNFQVDYVYLKDQLSAKQKVPVNQRYHIYGELAREGISCATCHHIDPPTAVQVANWRPKGKGWIPKTAGKVNRQLAYFLFHNTTGRFETSPPDELNGPLKEVKTYPMETAMGIRPVHNDFITKSEMCGTCHTINLPNIGLEKAKFPVLNAAETNEAFKGYNHSIEQATFLEWQNSIFGQPMVNGKPNPKFQSCQDCHMPGSFKSLDGSIDIDQVTTKIATIQDATYPEVEFAASDEDIGVVPRGDYNRHEHVGLNVFLLEMFDQFPDILGVSKQDYMTSATTGNALAIENMVRQARETTIDLDMKIASPMKGNKLNVDVTVTNLTGHRFPSGVSFRRAFLEVLVMEGEDIIWASGRTNAVGVIVGEDGTPLETEFLPNKNSYQRHHQIISSQDSVQIYEELNQNMERQFTTSFVHRVYPIKDNRLLPQGWRASSHFKKDGEVLYQFMEATDPEGLARDEDPDYDDIGPDFKGQDQIRYAVQLPKGVDKSNLSVKVTMYSQAIPPYWLHQRFSTAPNEPGTQRLYHMTSRLNLKGTAMENWKLPLQSVRAKYSAVKGWKVKEEALPLPVN